MWMSSHKHTSPPFSYERFASPTKERLAAIRGTASCRHTYLECVLLSGTVPRALFLSHRTVRSFCLPVLPVVESFPGAPSPLGSKEPNEPALLLHFTLCQTRHPSYKSQGGEETRTTVRSMLGQIRYPEGGNFHVPFCPNYQPYRRMTVRKIRRVRLLR